MSTFKCRLFKRSQLCWEDHWEAYMRKDHCQILQQTWLTMLLSQPAYHRLTNHISLHISSSTQKSSHLFTRCEVITRCTDSKLCLDSLAVAKKIDRTTYDIQYGCKTYRRKCHILNSQWLCDHAAHGYSSLRNFGGSVFAVCRGWMIHPTATTLKQYILQQKHLKKWTRNANLRTQRYNFQPYIPTLSFTMHTAPPERDGQTDRWQYDTNSRSYCVTVWSAKRWKFLIHSYNTCTEVSKGCTTKSTNIFSYHYQKKIAEWLALPIIMSSSLSSSHSQLGPLRRSTMAP